MVLRHIIYLYNKVPYFKTLKMINIITTTYTCIKIYYREIRGTGVETCDCNCDGCGSIPTRGY